MQTHIQIFKVLFSLFFLLCLLAGCASADADVPQTESGAFVITARSAATDKFTAPVETSAAVTDDASFLANLTAGTTEAASAVTETTPAATETMTATETAAATTPATTISAVKPAPTADADYVCNTNSKKFHLPTCDSVNKMKSSNRQNYSGSREDLLAKGYSPCKRCSP